MGKTNPKVKDTARIRRYPCVIGVDPGLDGGIAVVNSKGELLAHHDMPSKKKLISRTRKRLYDTSALNRLIETLQQEHHVNQAAVERVASSPQMGVASAFSFGHGYGILHGVLAGRGMSVLNVEPTVWKRKMMVSGTDKSKSVAKAEELFGLKMKDGVAEAALIAYYVLKGHDTWS